MCSSDLEWESCATQEGWAEYVGLVSWWNPEAASVGQLPGYFDFEDKVPMQASCPDNKQSPGQVAKAFWDLDDAASETGAFDADGDGHVDADTTDLSSTSIAAGWGAFVGGSSDHQRNEPGPNGVNVKDYNANYSVNTETLVKHNCLWAQQ